MWQLPGHVFHVQVVTGRGCGYFWNPTGPRMSSGPGWKGVPTLCTWSWYQHRFCHHRLFRHNSWCPPGCGPDVSPLPAPLPIEATSGLCVWKQHIRKHLPHRCGGGGSVNRHIFRNHPQSKYDKFSIKGVGIPSYGPLIQDPHCCHTLPMPHLHNYADLSPHIPHITCHPAPLNGHNVLIVV